jgi:hypothetical protein
VKSKGSCVAHESLCVTDTLICNQCDESSWSTAPTHSGIKNEANNQKMSRQSENEQLDVIPTEKFDA